ncbi:hypothetical protein [Actinomadura sp. 3N407]|uniref:hypothetical protein n=1 Tax=Actinomadura sp. 3N407 TaxID=3457423 RepID=UPI003FCD19D9
MAYEFPDHLVELRRSFNEADARISHLAREPLDTPTARDAWEQVWKRAQDIVLALHADPFWNTVDNPAKARMALQQVAREQGSPAGG